MIWTEVSTPLGPVTLAAEEGGLRGLWFVGQAYDKGPWVRARGKEGDCPVFCQARQWLEAYFSGTFLPVTLPLAPEGTAFQKGVWEILRTISPGKTMTYGQIAGLLEARDHRRVSAQAVGGAVGRNPLSLLIPCHRVVGAQGQLTGYAAGLSVKRRLLELEGANFDSRGRLIR